MTETDASVLWGSILIQYISVSIRPRRLYKITFFTKIILSQFAPFVNTHITTCHIFWGFSRDPGQAVVCRTISFFQHPGWMLYFCTVEVLWTKGPSFLVHSWATPSLPWCTVSHFITLNMTNDRAATDQHCPAKVSVFRWPWQQLRGRLIALHTQEVLQGQQDVPWLRRRGSKNSRKLLYFVEWPEECKMSDAFEVLAISHVGGDRLWRY